jgi:hypothetical protein
MKTPKVTRQWKPITTPHGITEFGTRNQAHANFNTFETKHKKMFGKIPEIKFSEKFVTKKIKGEKHLCLEYKAVLKTSLSLFRGKFVGISFLSREAAMEIAVALANEKFTKSKTSHKKERKLGIVKTMLDKIKSKQIV